MGTNNPSNPEPTDAWPVLEKKKYLDELEKPLDKKPLVTLPTAQPTLAALDEATRETKMARFPPVMHAKGNHMDDLTGTIAETRTNYPIHAPRQPESTSHSEWPPELLGLCVIEAPTVNPYSDYKFKPIQQLFIADRGTKTNASSISAHLGIDTSPRSPKEREIIKRIEESKNTTHETVAIDDSVTDKQLNPPYGVRFSHTKYGNHKAVPFTTIKQLGHGSLGSVDAVRQNDDELGPVLARKVIRLPNMARKRLLPIIQQEVDVLRSLTHRHITRVVSTYETTSVPRQFGIILSPAGDEDLSHFLERAGENEFPEEDLIRLRKWLVCLTSAVSYIHSQNIRHQDIKPNNIICKDDEVFLTDFGSCHQFTGLTSSTEGYAVGVTKMYSAPEVIAFDRRGRSADVYSLGCVFAEMFTVLSSRRIEDFHEFRSEPIPDEPDKMILVYSATAHKLEAWFAMQDDPWPFSLTSRMMADGPTARPTAEDLLKELTQLSMAEICNCHSVIAAYDEAANEPSAFEDDLNHINEITFSVAMTVGQNPTPKSAHSVLSSPIFPSAAGFAFQASVTLCKTLQSSQFHSKKLRDLNDEVEAFSGVLGSLTETVISTTDVDLSALDLPLLRCGNACKDFEQEIMRCSNRSGGSRRSLRDWAKLRYMGDNIDGFRQLLAGYKSTIILVLATANLATSVESITRQMRMKALDHNFSLSSALSGLSHIYLDNRPETVTGQKLSASGADFTGGNGNQPKRKDLRVDESKIWK